MLMERDTFHEINLNLVGGGDAAQQIVAGTIHRLRNRKNRRDVVAGGGEVRSEKSIVHVEFPGSRPLRPSRPFRTDAIVGRDPLYGGAPALPPHVPPMML